MDMLITFDNVTKVTSLGLGVANLVSGLGLINIKNR